MCTYNDIDQKYYIKNDRNDKNFKITYKGYRQ